MKILISNDDGIDAPGLRSLCERFALEHEVYVLAPAKDRSAMGHALTLHKPLRVDEMESDYFRGVRRAYAIEGTPADCVKIAIREVLDFRPDWVLSGINHGPNMGTDVLYSGTVSAAIEGAIHQIKSIAFSSAEYKADDFNEVALSAYEVFEFLSQKTAGLDTLGKSVFNVNIPIIERSKLKGKAITCLADRMYSDSYDKRTDPRGRYYYWLWGDLLKSDKDPNSDIQKTQEKYISITPLSFKMMDYDLAERLA